MPSPQPRSVGIAAWLVVAGLAGCAMRGGVLLRTIMEFCDAVQAEDLERLYCLSAGATESTELGADPDSRRAGFEAWARQQYELYAAGRDAGFVELEPHGFQLVRLFGLARGTYVDYTQPPLSVGHVRSVKTELRFGYGAVDLSRFSPGTTIYFSGTPVGTSHAVEIPSGGGEVELEVLDRITVEWTLVRGDERAGCPAGWAVASAVPVPGTEHAVRLRWIF